ncbi:uncharacterized protein [Nicotiana sylvestris]|uniref:uncharacterized protein n=1 Tax=Nicotiana sylvestris TaxID=4096 RepID=UPI00388C47C0
MSRGRGRGRVSSLSSPQNHIYTLARRQDQKSLPDVVTGILSVSLYDVYTLIDPGSALSYVTPLVASKFEIKPELVKPFEVSTPIGDSVIAKQVYRGCIIVVHGRSTIADLIELDMVEFDVIMGMDWLASCHANIDCRSKIVRFQFPEKPILEFKGLPLEREIEFAIDLLPDTPPISIPPYRMDPTELKELKEQLRDLLEKEAEHADQLRTVLRVLQEGKLYAKNFKCEFWLNFVAFVGHIVLGEAHLTKLTQKGEKFQWIDACEQSFQALKDILALASIKDLNLQLTSRGPSKKDWGLKWLELLKDYDIDILHHPGKANVVADALRRKSMGSLAHLKAYQRALAMEVHQLASFVVRLLDSNEDG